MEYKGFIIEEAQGGGVYIKLPEPIIESTFWGWYESEHQAKSFINDWLRNAKLKKLAFK